MKWKMMVYTSIALTFFICPVINVSASSPELLKASKPSVPSELTSKSAVALAVNLQSVTR